MDKQKRTEALAIIAALMAFATFVANGRRSQQPQSFSRVDIVAVSKDADLLNITNLLPDGKAKITMQDEKTNIVVGTLGGSLLFFDNKAQKEMMRVSADGCLYVGGKQAFCSDPAGVGASSAPGRSTTPAISFATAVYDTRSLNESAKLAR